MKIIGIILSIILWFIPGVVWLFTLNLNSPPSLLATILIGGWIGWKSSDDAERFYKWFKSRLK